MNNLSRRKWVAYIVVGLLALGIIGYILYSFFVLPATRPPEELPGISGRPIGGIPSGGTPTGEQPTGTPPLPDLPSIAEQKLVRLTDFSVVAPSLNKTEDKILFYKKDGGDLLASDFQGKQLEKLSNLTIVGLMEAVWAPTRDRAAVLYLDSGAVKGFLHIGTSSVAILPQDITSAAWSPDGKSFAYTRRENDDLLLVVSDAAGKNPRTVFKTPVFDARIQWVDANRIEFATPPSGLAEGYAFAFTRASGAFGRVLGPIFGLQTLWSPAASKILISRTPRGSGQSVSSVYDAGRRESRPLDTPSFADKCIWGNEDEIWCAAPRDFAGATLLPDQYLTGEFHPSDRIMRIDLKSGTTEEILGEGNFDMEHLIITKDKKYLFFVNRGDGTLWSLNLK